MCCRLRMLGLHLVPAKVAGGGNGQEHNRDQQNFLTAARSGGLRILAIA